MFLEICSLTSELLKVEDGNMVEFNYSHSSFFAAKNRMLKTERDKKEFGPENDYPFYL